MNSVSKQASAANQGAIRGQTGPVQRRKLAIGAVVLRMPRSLVLGQIALLLVASAACAAKTTRPPMPDSVRNELGAVAVVALPAQPKSSLAYPVPSRAGAAVVGASAGLGAGVLAGATCFIPGGWTCLFVAWTPVMVVTGGVEGAVKGVPIAELRASATSLRDVAGEPDLARSLAERVAAEAARRVGEGRVRFTADALPEAEGGSSRSPAPGGADTVLEVRLERLGLERAGSQVSHNPGYGPSFSIESLIDPMLALVVEARVRVLRAADGMTLYEGAFVQRAGGQKFTEWGREGAAQRAGGQKFTEWGREGAAAFRRERDLALAALAEDIATTIFGLVPIFGLAPAPRETTPPSPTSDEPPSTVPPDP